MTEREKVIIGLEKFKTDFKPFCGNGSDWERVDNAINLLKEQEAEYEIGFNDAMLGKQELMYEGTDGKWHKKDW